MEMVEEKTDDMSSLTIAILTIDQPSEPTMGNNADRLVSFYLVLFLQNDPAMEFLFIPGFMDQYGQEMRKARGLHSSFIGVLDKHGVKTDGKDIEKARYMAKVFPVNRVLSDTVDEILACGGNPNVCVLYWNESSYDGKKIPSALEKIKSLKVVLLLSKETFEVAKIAKKHLQKVTWIGSMYRPALHEIFLGGNVAMQWLTEVAIVYLALKLGVPRFQIIIKDDSPGIHLGWKWCTDMSITVKKEKWTSHLQQPSSVALWQLMMLQMRKQYQQGKLQLFCEGGEGDDFRQRFRDALWNDGHDIWRPFVSGIRREDGRVEYAHILGGEQIVLLSTLRRDALVDFCSLVRSGKNENKGDREDEEEKEETTLAIRRFCERNIATSVPDDVLSVIYRAVIFPRDELPPRISVLDEEVATTVYVNSGDERSCENGKVICVFASVAHLPAFFLRRIGKEDRELSLGPEWHTAASYFNIKDVKEDIDVIELCVERLNLLKSEKSIVIESAKKFLQSDPFKDVLRSKRDLILPGVAPLFAIMPPLIENKFWAGGPDDLFKVRTEVAANSCGVAACYFYQPKLRKHFGKAWKKFSGKELSWDEEASIELWVNGELARADSSTRR